MKLWRIAHPRYALDRSCAGAARYGGRWNPIGTPAFYCAASIALAALKKFVHLAAAPLPPLALVEVDLPDDEAMLEADVQALPPDWARLPGSGQAQGFGATWLAAGTQLAMRVPSAIIPEETNVVINPHHPAYGRVKLAVLRPFTFDARMLSKPRG
jgi:RES domain-containing protein